MPTYFASHPDFARHLTGTGHPERPERYHAVARAIDAAGLLPDLIAVHAEPVDDAPLLTCHSPGHLEAIAAACARAAAGARDGMGPVAYIDPDTGVCAQSDRIARLAVGHILAACDAVLADASARANAFCLTRPPGHHATRDRVMGFCLYAHVAIAARHLQRQHGLRRVLILDWDVHHGNGTQDLLYTDPHSFYISLHQHPFYPGTGDPRLRGEGPGEGLNLNLPLPAGSGHDAAVDALHDTVLPAMRDYAPDFILISAGFDAHHRDPLAMLNWETETYRVYTDAVTALAAEVCCRGIVSVLEGGYDLEALADSAVAHLQGLVAAAKA